MKWFSALLDLLYPAKCPFCQRVQDLPGICPACLSGLPWTEDSLRELEPGLPCAAPLWYTGPVRDAIRRLKFHNGLGAAAPLGGLIAQCAAESLSGQFDTVTWAPVSARRLRQRGYDQARLLAEYACRSWGVQPVPLLRKYRDTPAQSSLQDAAARRKNTLHAYRPAQPCQGARVLLIDDVCTTGSTLIACAKALRSAGAASVVCAAAAFPAPPRENKGEKAKE